MVRELGLQSGGSNLSCPDERSNRGTSSRIDFHSIHDSCSEVFSGLQHFLFTCQLAQLLSSSLSARKVSGSIPGPVKSDTELLPLRRFFRAVLPRR